MILSIIKTYCKISSIKHDSTLGKNHTEPQQERFNINNVYICNLNPNYYDREIIIHAIGNNILKKKHFNFQDIAHIENVLNKIGCIGNVYLSQDKKSLYIDFIEPDNLVQIKDRSNPYNVDKQLQKKINSMEKTLSQRLFAATNLESIKKEIALLNLQTGKKLSIEKQSDFKFSPITICEKKVYIKKVIYRNVPKNIQLLLEEKNFIVSKKTILKTLLESFTESYHTLGNLNNRDVDIIKNILMDCGYFDSNVEKKVFFLDQENAVVVYDIELGNYYSPNDIDIIIHSKSCHNLSSIKKTIDHIKKTDISFLLTKDKVNNVLKSHNFLCRELHISTIKDKVQINMDLEYDFILMPKIETIFYNNFSLANRDLNKFLEKNKCFIGDKYDESQIMSVLKKLEDKLGTTIVHDKTQHGQNVSLTVTNIGESSIIDYLGQNFMSVNFQGLELSPIKFKWNSIFNQIALFFIQPKFKMHFSKSFPDNLSLGTVLKLDHDNFWGNNDMNLLIDFNFPLIKLLADIYANKISNNYQEYANLEFNGKFLKRLSQYLNISFDNRYYNTLPSNCLYQLIDRKKNTSPIPGNFFTVETNLNYDWDWLHDHHSFLFNPGIHFSNNRVYKLNAMDFQGVTLRGFYTFQRNLYNLSANCHVFSNLTPICTPYTNLNDSNITHTFLSNPTKYSQNIIGYRLIGDLKILDSMNLVNMPFFSCKIGLFNCAALGNKHNQDDRDKIDKLLNSMFYMLISLGIIIYISIMNMINIGFSLGLEIYNGSWKFTTGMVFFILPTTPQIQSLNI